MKLFGAITKLCYVIGFLSTVQASTNYYYILPSVDSPCPLLDVPCVTLTQLSRNEATTFYSNTTLILLPGVHTLEDTFVVQNVSVLRITTQAIVNVNPKSVSSKVTVVCTNHSKFVFKDISDLVISGTNFMVDLSLKSNIAVEYQILNFEHVTGAEVNNSSVYGRFFVNKSTIIVLNCNLTALGANNESSGNFLVTTLNSTLVVKNSCFNMNSTKEKTSAVNALYSIIEIANSTVKDSCSIYAQINYCYTVNSTITVRESNLIAKNSLFINNNALNNGGVLSALNSTVSIVESRFHGNTAKGSGGAIWFTGNTSFVIVRSFLSHNQAKTNGGAMYVAAFNHNKTAVQIEYINNTFKFNKAQCYGGAVITEGTTPVSMFGNTFRQNIAQGKTGGAMYISHQEIIEVKSNEFIRNVACDAGGAVAVSTNSKVTFNHSTFTENEARWSGGAVHITKNSSTLIVHSKFKYNKGSYGAAVYSNTNTNSKSATIVIKDSLFLENLANVSGGTLYTSGSLAQVLVSRSEFCGNLAMRNGGAIYASTHDIQIHSSLFHYNKALSGGALYAFNSTVNLSENNTFVQNSATESGGAAFLSKSALNVSSDSNLKIINNSGNPGTLYIAQCRFLIIRGTTEIKNNTGSFFIFYSNVTFVGNSTFVHNIAGLTNTSMVSYQEGGGITGVKSEVVFKGISNFMHNKAANGGAIKITDLSKLIIHNIVTITQNQASSNGGGIFSYQSEIIFMKKRCILVNNNAEYHGGGLAAISSALNIFEGTILFAQNTASKGGGLSLSQNAKVSIIKEKAECGIRIPKHCRKTSSRDWLKLEFRNNTAKKGGAIFVNDNKSDTCNNKVERRSEHFQCFFQVLAFHSVPTGNDHKKLEEFAEVLNIKNTNFTHNIAHVAGPNLFGGLLDRCSISPYAEVNFKYNISSPFSDAVSFIKNTTNIQIESIASPPVQVWFCENNQPDSNYQPGRIDIEKGKLFNISVVAVDQVNKTVPATIYSYLSSQTSSLDEGQARQNTPSTCTTLQYRIRSNKQTETLNLYAYGPCKNKGMSKRKIKIMFLPCSCPIGFQQSPDKDDCDCHCDSSISKYVTKCFNSNSSILRHGEFWIAYKNSSYKAGFLIYPNCPFDYCYSSTRDTYINLNDPDGNNAQCAFNRLGVLCGSCREGLSLSLGSSQCLQCSSHRIALIIPFAIAGIALVAFLLVCNLTVAVGTINGLIFYANIVIANRSLFFPFHKPNIMTVFIAWLNLDLGIETCFYNGMDAYAKIWLQLVFPLYLILLVVIVIIVSEKSSRFAKLLAGRNPVATLVTVILLSYTKLLRTIIYALAAADIDYPDSVHTVWLFDGNMDYLKGKHIPLFIAAVIIIIVGLVFTFILFSWQWILQLSDKVKVLRRITNPKLNSVMDAYHAPFNPKYRYWSGLLLFVRVLLYVLSAGNIYGDPRASLVIINIAMTCLIVFKLWFGNRMYKKWILNILEDVFIINIIIFAVSTKYMKNNNLNAAQLALAYTSTSIAITTFCGILVYHTFAFIINTKVAKKVCYYLQQCQKKFSIFSHDREEYDTQLEQLIGKPSSDDYRLAEISAIEQPVTSTVVSL